jgi:AcrR family transcriptional regulator
MLQALVIGGPFSGTWISIARKRTFVLLLVLRLQKAGRGCRNFVPCRAGRGEFDVLARTRTAALRKGARTRETILRAAVDIASVEGLEGLTIGRLAEELDMSKSGLFAHFGSKEELQLATVEMARQVFVQRIIRPALAQPEGLPRLLALIQGWLDHVEGRIFKGGCFFTAASFEFDSRSGRVRDAIADAMRTWLGVLSRAIQGAQKARHIKAGLDAEQFAFEIYSLAMGANWALQLLDDKQAMAKAKQNILHRIRFLATANCPAIKMTPISISRPGLDGGA